MIAVYCKNILEEKKLMKKNNKKGFTLVELVIVVAVMAVLVAVAIPTVKSITETARGTVADTNARTIESVIKLAEAEASKDGNDIADLTGTKIASAITEAKLGINEGRFVYNPDNGTVEALADDASAGEGEYVITFASGVVSVSPTT